MAQSRISAAAGEKITSFLRRFSADNDGATAIEYAMIAGGISIGIIALVFSIGGSVADMFTAVDDEFSQ